MAFKDFSEYKYVKTFDSNEEIRMGGFQVVTSGFLKYVRVMLVMSEVASLVGTETLTMKVYADQNLTSLLYTSGVVSISDIDYDPLLHSWVGFVRFDFTNKPINKNYFYYPTVTIANFTPAMDFWIGLNYDWPDPVYDNGNTLFYQQAIAMQIFLES